MHNYIYLKLISKKGSCRLVSFILAQDSSSLLEPHSSQSRSKSFGVRRGGPEQLQVQARSKKKNHFMSYKKWHGKLCAYFMQICQDVIRLSAIGHSKDNHTHLSNISLQG